MNKTKYLILGLALLGQSGLLAAASTEQIRVQSVERQADGEARSSSKTSQGYQAESQAGTNDSVVKQKSLARQAAPSISKNRGFERAEDPDFWIYDAFITYNRDDDYDGYYSALTIEFDADTYYLSADVYARLYLARSDVFEEFHTTSVFTIYGDSSSDALIIDSVFESGFPPGDYEMLIELYDAYDDRLVASFDGYNDVDLTLITLESQNHDYRETQVVITTESGGSAGYLLLLMIPMIWWRRQVKG